MERAHRAQLRVLRPQDTQVQEGVQAPLPLAPSPERAHPPLRAQAKLGLKRPQQPPNLVKFIAAHMEGPWEPHSDYLARCSLEVGYLVSEPTADRKLQIGKWD